MGPRACVPPPRKKMVILVPLWYWYGMVVVLLTLHRRLRHHCVLDPLRRARSSSRGCVRDPRLLPVTHYLSPPHRAAILRIATSCRARSHGPAVPLAAFGDVVENYLSPPGVGARSSQLGRGTCHLVHGEWLVWLGVRFSDLTWVLVPLSTSDLIASQLCDFPESSPILSGESQRYYYRHRERYSTCSPRTVDFL